jgi:folate-binding protein YgfZ
VRDQDRSILIDTNPDRWWIVSPAGASPDALASLATVDREAWRAADIAAGLPQVHARTSEAFVAQMLNLDELGGIAFDKGCYTGQEVIARAHYRGRVKRRMQRFRSLEAAKLATGDTGQLHDNRSFRVVEAVQLEDGRCEFLAVAATTPSAGVAEASDGTTADAPKPVSLQAETLPLPYTPPT